jgi:DNA-binding NarL/FixJ family response regulator/mannose-6-phosphate isomerase-like protein (cupin superfamily)
VSLSVLIVDDQALVRAGFRMILDAEADIEVAGEAADGAEAVEQAHRIRPDVILMDVRMPQVDGIEATRRLLSVDGLESKVVMLTTFDMDEYVYDALRAGASGFLLKDVPPEQLVAGIRAVAQGDALLAPSVTRRVIEEFVRRPPSSMQTMPPEVAELTARELEVLKLVAKGLSNAEIAKELFVSETTVKTHVAHVLTKLGVRDRVQVVVLAYECGLAGVVREDDESPSAPTKSERRIATLQSVNHDAKEAQMIRSGDTIENPLTGERITFHTTSADTNGEAVVIECVVQPDGFVAAAHVHPSQTERFNVIDGRLGMKVGRKKLLLERGDVAVVESGKPHKFWNMGNEEVRFVCEVRPALQFESLLETMFALAADGKTSKKGMPNPLRLAVIARAHFDTVRLPQPPAWLQRAGLALGAPLGRLLGYGPTYEPQAGTPAQPAV